MKFYAYVAVCLCLPFAHPAKGETDATNRVPSEAAQSELGAGFERYRTILDRMPFGRPPPGFDPDSPGGATAGGAAGTAAAGGDIPASEEEQQILASVRVSALNVTPSGKITVGFTDSSVQPPRNYFMEVGEKRGEWTVVEANPDPEKKMVKLSKGGVEATFKLGVGSDPKDGKKASAAGARPAGGLVGRAPVRTMDAKSQAATAVARPSGLEIARARREKMRMEREADAAQRRQADEQARKDREEAQKAAEQAAEERKAQREQLTAIQEMLRQQREEKQAEEERRAAEGRQREE